MSETDAVMETSLMAAASSDAKPENQFKAETVNETEAETVNETEAKTVIGTKAETVIGTETVSETEAETNCKTESETVSASDFDSIDKLSNEDLKIIQCVEYYFGNFNLPRDQYLKFLVKQDPEGWVTIDDLLKFNRLKSLCNDPVHICKVLKFANKSIIQVSENLKKVRRPSELPADTPEYRADVNNRTVYVKGFPVDTTFDEIQDFLSQFGETENIFMRRFKRFGASQEKTFKGSIFTLFAKLEDAKAFVDKPDVQFRDLPIIKMFRSDYFEKKKLEKKNAKQSKCEEKVPEPQITKNAIVLAKGLNAESTIESIKTAFGDYGQVRWVELNKGKPEAYIRFVKEEEANTVLEKLSSGTIEIDDSTVKVSLVTGQEEADYWARMASDRLKQEKNFSNSKYARSKRNQGQGEKRKSYYKGGGRGGKKSKTD